MKKLVPIVGVTLGVGVLVGGGIVALEAGKASGRATINVESVSDDQDVTSTMPVETTAPVETTVTTGAPVAPVEAPAPTTVYIAPPTTVYVAPAPQQPVYVAPSTTSTTGVDLSPHYCEFQRETDSGCPGYPGAK